MEEMAGPSTSGSAAPTTSELDTASDANLSALASAEEYLLRNPPAKMLPFQRDILVDLMHADCLVVCARGINYNPAVFNLLQAHSDPGNLVLVINSADYEERYFKSVLNRNQVHDSSTNAKEREITYLLGGIQFLTTRILIVDLLKGRIPIELVTGIIVLRAHKIIESCQEAFALRLYRQRNKTGFIKAFSNSVEAFTYGYGHVEKVMRNLFVTDLYLWPRFQATIQKCLRAHEPQVVELHVPITSRMTQIQSNVLDIMNLLVKELRRMNRFVDLAEITVENCIAKQFHKILQSQLDCIWHQLNAQTKLMVADLKVLRSIMISTIYNDAVSLYVQMRQYRGQKYALSSSGWVLSDAADQMFRLSKERVFNSDDEFEPELCPKWRVLSEILRVEIPNAVRKSIAHHPNALNEAVKVLILCQDARTCYQLNQYLTLGGERFLLYTAMKNDLAVNRISEKYKTIQAVDAVTSSIYLAKKNTLVTKPSGSSENTTIDTSANDPKNPPEPAPTQRKGFLRDRIAKRKHDQSTATGSKPSVRSSQDDFEEVVKENDAEPADELSMLVKDDSNDNDGLFRESYILTMSQLPEETQLNATCDPSVIVTFESFAELDNLNVTQVLSTITKPIVCIQTFKNADDGTHSLDRTLAELDPGFVIMYHSNITAIRQIEVFEAERQCPVHQRLQVFFLMHSQTVEEQSYLTSLRREKQAFDMLIETKRTMVVPEYQDGKSDDMLFGLKKRTAEDCPEESPADLDTIATTPRIIVDMREFRSELPCLIHRRGIEVVPVTITIGDYILTPEICVERKSISDLIGSLNSGRLYNQCVQMTRHYPKPILLIEFDQNKPFHLQGHYMISDMMSKSNVDIVQKLQLLTIYFPRLRLVWSPSPYATAQLFEELKVNRAEPDPLEAAAHGSDDATSGGGGPADIEQIVDKVNPTLHDFLLKLPGITSKNVGLVLRKVTDMKALLALSEPELTEILAGHSGNAKLLWQILHVVHKPPTVESGGDRVFASRFQKGRGGRF